MRILALRELEYIAAVGLQQLGQTLQYYDDDIHPQALVLNHGELTPDIEDMLQIWYASRGMVKPEEPEVKRKKIKSKRRNPRRKLF